MKSLPSILLSAFAIILLTGQASIGGQTTDECLVKPGPPGPKGTHWHYHINRADGQHCWYLSSQGEQTAGQVYPGMQHAEPPNPSPQAADISAPKCVRHHEVYTHDKLPSRALRSSANSVGRARGTAARKNASPLESPPTFQRLLSVNICGKCQAKTVSSGSIWFGTQTNAQIA